MRADNPSPMTLDGTNSYVVRGGWVVDPGPADEEHVRAVVEALGGEPLAGVVLTHDHGDHSGAIPLLLEAAGPAPVHHPGATDPASGPDPASTGPFRVLPTPGHSADSVCLLLPGGVCFTGDSVLGEGSVFISPEGGSLGDYLDSLRMLRSLDLSVLCPGHGPLVGDPVAKIDEYIAHRLERERLLLEALAAGARGEDELLDHAWSDVPAALRPAAALTLRTHLAKLRDERRLPSDMTVP